MEAERGQAGREECQGGCWGLLAGFLVCLQAPNQAALLALHAVEFGQFVGR